MAIKVFFFLLFFVPHSTSFTSSKEVRLKQWCKHTPHPRTCVHNLVPRVAHNPLKTKADFYKLSLKVAYNLTLQAQFHLSNSTARACKRKSCKAILDCSKLYHYTLKQLDRTLNAPPQTYTTTDKQVWLSAALTNLRTCKKGFSDLKASNNIITAIYKRYSILDLISNCLAINRRVNSNVSLPSTNGFTALHAGWNSNLLHVHEVPKANFIVSKNGSSDYNSIQAAVNVAASMRLNGYEKRIVIYVKAGVYRETVTISSSLNDLTVIGDGMGKTIVTSSRSVARGYTTFSSPTFSVFGDRFLARGMTFRNTYGPGSQAVALLSGSDQSVFYRCSIEGYQDTLCVYTQRQFYRNCKIYGTIDFIFGNAAAVIQNCNILVRKPIHGESNVITAQGRTDPNQNTGIVIQSCRIRATSELWAAKQTVKSFLGRPWMKYSRTVYLQNVMDDIIHPLGWMPFDGEFGLSTLYYVEYNNTGGGSRTRLRVRWRGYRVIDRASLVRRFTVAGFIGGAAWLPATRVPFSLTL